jgi:hypothetical protein
MTKNKDGGFTLVEVVVATLLLAVVFGMIMVAVVMVNKAVMNEHPISFSEYHGSTPAGSGWYASWGYWEGNSTPGFQGYDFPIAPSRAADAQADALWKQLRELYEQSTSVAVIHQYVIHNFSVIKPNPLVFCGGSNISGRQGYLSIDANNVSYPPFTYAQLTANDSASNSVLNNLISRFPTGALPTLPTMAFDYWNDITFPFPAAGNDQLDQNSYRAATIFFLAPGDRVLGVLRMRAFQFVAAAKDPYRYYEVTLSHVSWSPPAFPMPQSGVNTAWAYSSFTEDYAYRFAEDKRFPQNLIFPPTNAQMADLAGESLAAGGTPDTATTVASGNLPARNIFIRLAKAGEDYTPGVASGSSYDGEWANNMNPGVSRRQVSLAPTNLTAGALPVLTAGVDEWHLILPDPGLGQAEERAALYQSVLNQNNGVYTPTAAQQAADLSIRRQGKYGCVLSLYP